MRRIISMITILSMITLLFAGCSKKVAENSEEPSKAAVKVEESGDTPVKGDTSVNETEMFQKGGEKPICKEKVSLSICVPDNASIEDFETNFQTKLLEEYGNYDLTFETYPNSDFLNKINLITSSGGEDLADIIVYPFSDNVVYQYAQAGAIVPVTQYYKDPDASYYIQDAIKRTGVDFTELITSPDGEIYGIPAYNQSLTNEYPAKIFIYQPWLDKLNLEVPTTIEEFYNVLNAFATQDPNGNGKNDEVPIMSYKSTNYWFQALMNPFIYAGDRNYYVVDNGKVSVAYNTDGWRNGLAYIKKLFDNNLMNTLTLTQDKSQYKTILNQEETVVGVIIDTSISDISITDARREEYIGIAPLKGDNGTQYGTYRPSVPKVSYVITKNCKNVEAAFRLGDLLCSEEFSIMTRFGEEGVDYLKATPEDHSMYEELGYSAMLKTVLPWGQVQNKHWAQTGPYIREYAINCGQVWDGDKKSDGYATSKAQLFYNGTCPEETIPKLIFTNEESEEIADISNLIMLYVQEMYAAFITGSKNLESDWDEYLDGLEGMGLETLLKNVNSAYTRMYGK